MLPNKAGQSAFLAPIHCEQFILFHLHFLYYSSSIEISESMKNLEKEGDHGRIFAGHGVFDLGNIPGRRSGAVPDR